MLIFMSPWQGLVLGERSSVPVCVPPVRLGYLPSGIYQVTVTSGPVTAAPRYQAPCLPRRLAHQSFVYPTGQNSCRFSAAGAPVPWLGYQLQQVRLGTHPAVRIYRHAVRHVRLHRGTPAQDAGQNPDRTGPLEMLSYGYSLRSPSNVGHVDLHSHPCAQRSASPPPNPVVGVGGLVPGDEGLV